MDRIDRLSTCHPKAFFRDRNTLPYQMAPVRAEERPIVSKGIPWHPIQAAHQGEGTARCSDL